MTERERLIELLKKKYDHFCDQCGVNKDSHYTENLADYLLDNGVRVMPFVAMIEKTTVNGEFCKKRSEQKFNGRYCVVYEDKTKWETPLIDICGLTLYDKCEAIEEMIMKVGAE